MVTITIKTEEGKVLKQYDLFKRTKSTNVYTLNEISDSIHLAYDIGSKEDTKKLFEILKRLL